jgi:regulator of extracellular matrix RemA (YlzA/DUF370 family)
MRGIMMISIGYKHFIESENIVELLKPNRLRATKMIQTAAEDGVLINATSGRKIRSIIKLKSKHIVLCALGMESLKSRLGNIILPQAPGNRDILRLKPKKNYESKTKPSKCDDRRSEPDRRHFSYSYHFPERRNGIARRGENRER